MKRSTLVCLVAIVLLGLACVLVVVLVMKNHPKHGLKEEEFQRMLRTEYEYKASDLCHRINIAQWNYDSDLKNQEKQNILLNVTLEASAFNIDMWGKYFKNVDPENYKDEGLKRQAEMLTGIRALGEEEIKTLKTTIDNMTSIYGTAKICPYNDQNCDLAKNGLSLEPDIEQIFANSTDYNELVYVWEAWRNASGAKMKKQYQTYVDLSNQAAVAIKLEDASVEWIYSYESHTFVDDIDKLWAEIEPLYLELHKYVSQKLKERYGNDLDISDGLIPAHVLGNVWAQSWNNIAELVRPFPNASQIDVDKTLIKQHYTVLKMFETADDFYKSMGLKSNQISYNTSAGAIIKKPNNGKEMICHASAWEFCDGQNYRIKMCTQVNYEDFVTIHHEMGHIQYYLQYAHQPFTFRDGANPGFHEAVGDTITLSVSTPKHLKRINLLESYTPSYESSINNLMDMALQKIAFMPFGLLVDKWRWDVFSGKIDKSKWNTHWWEYRKKYQKVKPPVERSENDFDPGAKYHVPADVPYIAYFVAGILQFQFYKSLCIAAGEYDPENKEQPLHECDFYQSKDAGKLLSDGLSLGASKHWSDVLELMTGERNMNATAILEYFEPLYKFLKKENR